METPFIDNKYTKWYLMIITRAQSRVNPFVYTESHHVLPKSLGGSNEKSNIVRLTAREHFICHSLLWRMLPTGKERNKMIWSASNMMRTMKGKMSSRYIPKASSFYEKMRILHSESLKGENNPCYGKKKGPMSEESKAKLSASRREILKDGSIAKKISEALKGLPFKKRKPMNDKHKLIVSKAHKGKVISEEQRSALSASLKGRKIPQDVIELRKERRRLNDQRRAAGELPPLKKRIRKPMSAETKAKIAASRQLKLSIA